jgi:hypothetical protein
MKLVPGMAARTSIKDWSLKNAVATLLKTAKSIKKPMSMISVIQKNFPSVPIIHALVRLTKSMKPKPATIAKSHALAQPTVSRARLLATTGFVALSTLVLALLRRFHKSMTTIIILIRSMLHMRTSPT